MHEILHRDIAIGNDYRKERIKLLITLATGVFALMVTFHKDLFEGRASGSALGVLLFGFVLLLLSLLFGIAHFRGWENFYLEHRGLSMGIWRHRTAGGDGALEDAGIDEFLAARRKIQAAQYDYRHYDKLQSAFLMLGLLCMAVFVAVEANSMPAEKQVATKAASQPVPDGNGSSR